MAKRTTGVRNDTGWSGYKRAHGYVVQTRSFERWGDNRFVAYDLEVVGDDADASTAVMYEVRRDGSGGGGAAAHGHAKTWAEGRRKCEKRAGLV